MDLHTLQELGTFFGSRLHDWYSPAQPSRVHVRPGRTGHEPCVHRHTQAAAVRGALALCQAPGATVPLPAEASRTMAAALAEHVHLQDLKEHAQQDCLELLSSLRQVRTPAGVW